MNNENADNYKEFSDPDLRTRICCPIGIGGVGGSGTRIVAEIITKMGIFLGDNLTVANDNLSWPNFRELIWLSDLNENEKKELAFREIARFREEIETSFFAQSGFSSWGWKAPGTFFWLHYFSEYFDNFAYIHVIRHGLEMAYSTNQNQTSAWSPRFGIDVQRMPMPKAALRYWIAANKLAISQGKNLLGPRFHILNFNRLCKNPSQEIANLSSFIGLRSSVEEVEALSDLVDEPDTLGRYHGQNMEIFDQFELDEVKKMGFELE